MLQEAQDRDQHDHAADDHVGPLGLQSGVLAALRDGFDRERAKDVLGGGAGQAEPVDAVAVVGGQALLDGCDRRDRPGQSDEGLRFANLRDVTGDVGEVIAYHRHRARQFLGGRRSTPGSGKARRQMIDLSLTDDDVRRLTGAMSVDRAE